MKSAIITGTWFKRLAMILIATAAAAGCQSQRMSSQGAVATQQENVVLKPGGPHSDQWQTLDVAVDFSYRREDASIQIEGTVRLLPRLTKSFRDVNALTIQVNLLDENNVVVKSESVLYVGRVPIESWRFNRSIAAPDNVVALNYSYSGSVRDQATETGGIESSFWQVP